MGNANYGAIDIWDNKGGKLSKQNFEEKFRYMKEVFDERYGQVKLFVSKNSPLYAIVRDKWCETPQDSEFINSLLMASKKITNETICKINLACIEKESQLTTVFTRYTICSDFPLKNLNDEVEVNLNKPPAKLQVIHFVIES